MNEWGVKGNYYLCKILLAVDGVPVVEFAEDKGELGGDLEMVHPRHRHATVQLTVGTRQNKKIK